MICTAARCKCNRCGNPGVGSREKFIAKQREKIRLINEKLEADLNTKK
jgi:hypothetical protein